ncbi:MAG: 3-dehydroquinate synthase [Prevotellaceae bacterium]|nr:3-dehydroquinate synthase [Prevotellaceae bacterium]
MMQRVIISQDLAAELKAAIQGCEHDRVFILTDETTHELCLPRVADFECLKDAVSITIPAGDTNKGLESVTLVWEALQRGGATRHSLLINLGGGMVTDLGGFAASCFKRGINFINIPTTLLSMVDASVGGKTGVNFGGLKNEIGVFNNASYCILDTMFLSTLDRENILSGYAEMLKHGLINREGEKMWAELVTFDIEEPDYSQLSRMLAESVAVKQAIVEEDPHEHGIRKALNVGHTAGHALESWAMRHDKPVLHGYAVAWGMIVELYLSAVKTHFPTDKMRQTVRFIREHYGDLGITCNDYPELLELMTHDKKNTAGIINFTLLNNICGILINQTANEEEIKEALDFLREG